MEKKNIQNKDDRFILLPSLIFLILYGLFLGFLVFGVFNGHSKDTNKSSLESLKYPPVQKDYEKYTGEQITNLSQEMNQKLSVLSCLARGGFFNATSSYSVDPLFSIGIDDYTIDSNYCIIKNIKYQPDHNGSLEKYGTIHINL